MAKADWNRALMEIAGMVQQNRAMKQQQQRWGAQMQMEQARVAEGQRRWEEGADARAEDLKRLKAINKDIDRQATAREEFETFTENLFTIVGDPDEFQFTTPEKFLEDPRIQELGPAAGQILMSHPELMEPYIQAERPLAERLMDADAYAILRQGGVEIDLAEDLKGWEPYIEWRGEEMLKGKTQAERDRFVLDFQNAYVMGQASYVEGEEAVFPADLFGAEFEQAFQAGWGASKRGAQPVPRGGYGGVGTAPVTEAVPLTNEQMKVGLEAYLTEPDAEGNPPTSELLTLRINELDGVIAQFEVEGNEEMIIFATNIKRRMQDKIQELLGPGKKVTKEGKDITKPLKEVEYRPGLGIHP